MVNDKNIQIHKEIKDILGLVCQSTMSHRKLLDSHLSTGHLTGGRGLVALRV